MKLGRVLEGAKLKFPLSPELADLEVTGLEYDSRRVEKGFVFFAFSGARADGREFASDAAARGALAFVSESPAPEGFSNASGAVPQSQPWIQVEHGRRALAVASRNFYESPEERIAFTGITGTNGKTTTSFLIDAILREAGFVTGLIGTIETRIAGERRETVNTTPESLDVLRFAHELESRAASQIDAKAVPTQNGAEQRAESQRGAKDRATRAALTMEVSSHALALGRVFGIRFHTAVFTNLTRDHLDFHHTMEEYAAAKRLLFRPEESPAPEWAVLNYEDPASGPMAGKARNEIWYGIDSEAQLRARKIASTFSGLRFELRYKGASQPIESPLVGRINVLNILAAAGAGISYGIDLETIARGIAACTAVPGRFERIDEDQPFLVAVDYAHTDDALRNVIQIARELIARSGVRGRVITLFGCGGDRDRTKRPLMGMAAGELSDYVVLTSDNPRSEDPIAIMNDGLVGLRRYEVPHAVEPDRAKAIRIALKEARAGDVVLLAGKGHETYQVLKDRVIDFDDRQVARTILREMGFKSRKEPG